MEWEGSFQRKAELSNPRILIVRKHLLAQSSLSTCHANNMFLLHTNCAPPAPSHPQATVSPLVTVRAAPLPSASNWIDHKKTQAREQSRREIRDRYLLPHYTTIALPGLPPPQLQQLCYPSGPLLLSLQLPIGQPICPDSPRTVPVLAPKSSWSWKTALVLGPL